MSEYQAWFFLAIAVLSAAGAWRGVYVALRGITNGRRTSIQQATLSFINDYNDDARVSFGHRVIRVAHDNHKTPKEILQGEERNNFLFLMNKFEILAVGLHHGIYDKDMILDSFGRDIREIYDKSELLIQHIRTTEADGEAFEKFEELAKNIRAKYHIQ